jgi:hypothetical protein
MWTVLPWVIGVLLIAAAALVPLLRGGARRRAFAAAKARATSAYERLGFSVETVATQGNQRAADAMTDAEERWNTAGALLAEATTAQECVVAEQAAREGIDRVREACRLLKIEVPQQ